MTKEISQGIYTEKNGQFGREFEIYDTDYYSENSRLYMNNRLFLPENSVCCLVGCNGIGKSTLIRQTIQDHRSALGHTAWSLGDKYSPFAHFMNDHKKEDYEEFYTTGNCDTRLGDEDSLIFQSLMSYSQSRGEKTIYYFGPIFKLLGAETRLLQGKRLFVFLDDLDVGVSIDKLREIADAVKVMAKTMSEFGVKYYILLTANSYELAKNFDCIDTVTLDHVSFNDYEDYSNYVCMTAKYKEQRNREPKKNLKKIISKR